MIRLFAGLSLPDTVKQRISSIMRGVNDLRWQREDQLHITLRFLGDMDEPRGADGTFNGCPAPTNCWVALSDEWLPVG